MMHPSLTRAASRAAIIQFEVFFWGQNPTKAHSNLISKALCYNLKRKQTSLLETNSPSSV